MKSGTIVEIIGFIVVEIKLKGNPNLRVIIKDGVSYLEISTFDKTSSNRAIKLSANIFTTKDI